MRVVRSVKGNIEARAVFGRMIGRLGRRCCGKPVALIGRLLLCYALFESTSPAAAQVLPSQVTVPNAITDTSTVVSGLHDGGAGYFVTNGALLTINNATLQNFTTTGGSGSGGGLGAGGAIFIDTGGTVVINNATFSHDVAIGGVGGTSSPYGGTLNSLGAVIPPNAGDPTGPPTNGTNGNNGVQVTDAANTFSFGDGKGNGLTGISIGINGGNASGGFGGIGGIGGPGTDGFNTNPIAALNVAIATQNLIAQGILTGTQAAQFGTWAAGAIADYASGANPFTAPLSEVTGITSTLLAVIAGINTVADGIAVASDIQALTVAAGNLAAWNDLYNQTPSSVGNGGAGENGGLGGAGSYGFGGGAGGQGGAYGLAGNPNAADGMGGSGGAGGSGGFGGGGGAGGYGYGAGQNGNGAAGATSVSGAGGAGGTAGFGGGVGSTGGVTGSGTASGGGGGSGYGGAIFVNAGATLIITGNATFTGDNVIGGASLNGGLGGGAAGSDLFMMTGSTVILAPGGGNVITFNGTIADNSNTSIGTPSFPLGANYPVSGGAGVTVYAGTTIFNGRDTYSGETVITGGALSGQLNPGTNAPGTPNYALTDGALQAKDGIGLPTVSNLNFSGPGQFTGGVLQTNGTFSRFVSATPNPVGGSNPGAVQWTGSGGFAAINAPLTVTLSGGQDLAWGQNGFVPFGYSLIFGSATSNKMVTFTNNIDIAGGSLGSGTAASILVANNLLPAGSIATMSGVLSGAGDLSINGGGFNGTLNLTGANTYTGATLVNSGTLMLSGAGSIASSSSLTLGPTATLDVSNTAGTGTTVPTLNGAGNVSLGGQELTVANGGVFTGVLSDGGAGGGTKGSLIIAGGTETLLGTNTYTGDTTIDHGATLALFGTGSIATSNPVIDNGIFDISQSALGASITSLAGNGQALIGSNFLIITNGSTNFSGDINDGGIGGGTGGNLIVTGGTQTLSGVNTYTGVTIVGSGATLALSDSGTFPTIVHGSIATSSLVDVLGTFDISQTTTGASITSLIGTGLVSLGAQTLTITAGATTFDGVIADGGLGNGTKGNLHIAGGIETLSGTNTYTGTTTIDLGTTLALIGGGSIATSSNVIDNGTFDISQTSAGASIMTLSGNSTGVVSLGRQTLTITNGSTTFAGGIADGGIAGGAGGMLAITGGTQTLSGTNTYTGATEIAPNPTSGTATLALLGNGSIATSSEVAIATNGTFDISQTFAGASIITLADSGTNPSGSVKLGGHELTITNGSTLFSGVLSDGGIGGGTKGSLIVAGGTQTLAGTNTYTGDTTIAPNPTSGTATLALIGNGSIATSSVVAIATGGTFDISQTVAGASIMTLADSGATPSGSVKLGAQTLTITNGSTTFSGVISDGGIGGGIGGNLTVSGGTQTLAGVNTYTGLTTIAPNPTSGTATLALINNGSIATSSEVLVATNGTFDISGTTAGALIMTLSGSGSVVLGSQTLTLTAAAAGPAGSDPAGIFSGVISGLGGMAITGGHEELTGVNTYHGGTLVNNGATLSINNSASLGATDSTLTLNNGTVIVDNNITIPQPVTLIGPPPVGVVNLLNMNSFDVTLGGAINGPGVLTAINGGTLNLTGTVSGLGGLVLGPGVTLTATAGANAGLVGTPIVLVPTGGGSGTDLFTGSVHVVGPLDVINGPTPELIILPGDTLVGVGSVNAFVVVQNTGGNAPGDGPGTIFIPAPVLDLAGSTYSVQIDGPTSSIGCLNLAGCAGEYSSVVVTSSGGSPNPPNTYTANGTIVPQLRGIGAPANNNYTAPVTQEFTVVVAPDGVLGSFAGITQPAVGQGLAAGTRFDALYVNLSAGPGAAAIPFAQDAQGNPTGVELWVTPSSYQNLTPLGVGPLTQNQNQVAYALDAMRGVNDLNPGASLPAGLKNNPQATWAFGQLFPQQPKNLPGIFNTLSGEVATDAKLLAMQMTDQFLELMLDTTVNGRNGVTSSGALSFASTGDEAQPLADGQGADPTLDYAALTKTPKRITFEQRWHTWAAAFGGHLNASGDAVVGSHDVTGNDVGVAVGSDYRFTPDTLLGFAIAGGGTAWNLDQSLGTGHSDAFAGGAYATTHFGSAYLASAISIANHWMATDRTAFAGDHLKAAYSGQSYGARVEAGYRIDMPVFALTPYLAGMVQRFAIPGYSETDLVGGGFGLHYNASAADEFRAEAGARVDSTLAVSDTTALILHVRGAVAYNKINDPGLVALFEAGFAPGGLPGGSVGFTVNGAAIPNALAIGSAGAELRFANKWSVLANFFGEFGSGSQALAGNGTVRYSW